MEINEGRMKIAINALWQAGFKEDGNCSPARQAGQ